MNTFLSPVTWGDFFEVILLVLVIYYLVIAARFFRSELRNLVQHGKFWQHAPGQSNPFAALQQQSEVVAVIDSVNSEHPGNNDQATPGHESLAESLKEVITELGEQPYQPASVPEKLKAVIQKYKHMQNAAHRAEINKMVAAECKKTGIALLREDEVDQLWRD